MKNRVCFDHLFDHFIYDTRYIVFYNFFSINMIYCVEGNVFIGIILYV